MTTKIKHFFRRLGGVAAVVAAFYSCASVGRIEGGPIDVDPPVFLRSTPVPGALDYDKPRVRIEFDEYIKLENPGEKVVISPPQVEQPEIKASGKRIIVNLVDSASSSTWWTR